MFSRKKVSNLKVVVIGTSGVGKTSIIESFFCGKSFDEHQQPTVGGNFIINKFTISDEEKVNLHVWDTGGQERFFALIPMYVRGANIVIFVWDASEPDTWRELVHKWLPLVQLHVGKCVLYYTLANKIDQINEEFYVPEVVSDYLNNMFFVSAKTKKGFEPFFNRLRIDIKDYCQRNLENSSEDEDEYVNLIKKKSRDRGCC